MVINFITGNAGKFVSMKEHVSKYGFEVKQTTLPIIEPQADTPEEVSLSKAKQAYELLHEPVAVEDSSFHIDALHGFPGPYIKYVMQTIGVDGILKVTETITERTCRFTSVLTFIDADGTVQQFVQKDDAGTLATKKDETPMEQAWSDLWRIFIPAGYSKPLSGLSAEENRQVNEDWQKVSTFTQFAKWLHENKKS